MFIANAFICYYYHFSQRTYASYYTMYKDIFMHSITISNIQCLRVNIFPLSFVSFKPLSHWHKPRVLLESHESKWSIIHTKYPRNSNRGSATFLILLTAFIFHLNTHLHLFAAPEPRFVSRCTYPGLSLDTTTWLEAGAPFYTDLPRTSPTLEPKNATSSQEGWPWSFGTSGENA